MVVAALLGATWTPALGANDHSNKGPVKPGIPVQGKIERGGSATWNFEARQGEFLRVTVDALPGSTLDPAVTVASESTGAVVVSGHSRTGLGHVRVSADCLPASGTYAVTASALQGHTGGRFTLTVEVLDQAGASGATTTYCRFTDLYVDHTEDECSRAVVRVHGQGGDVDVQKRDRRYIYIEDSGEILWDCMEAGASDNERAKCVSGTNVIRIERATSGRHIDWTCYRRQWVSAG
jgi:hypothetical protein